MQTNGRVKEAITGDMPPQNVEAEEALLGSILINNDVLLHIGSLSLTGADFFIERLGWIFDAISDLHRKNKPVDQVTLCDQLAQRGQLEPAGGPAYLTGLLNSAPHSTNGPYYAGIVKRMAIRRRVIDAAGSMVKLAHDDSIDVTDLLSQADRLVMDAAATLAGRRGATVDDILIDEVDPQYQAARQSPGLVGLSTGLTDLDKLLGGLKPRKMIVMAGRPGMGKTTLALQVAWQAVKDHGKRVLFFSLEMGRDELARKIWALESGVPSDLIESGRVSVEQAARLDENLDKLRAGRNLKIIDDATLTPEQLRHEAVAHWAKYGLDLIAVDYLQLMVSEKRAENRQAEVAAISRAIKALAGELNIPIIALSQLNRGVESRHDKRPMLSDLRESGAIEQDADAVLFLYRDKVYYPDTEFPNLAEINLAKHRGGKAGFASLFFLEAVSKFADVKRTPFD
jgi:replicative DNA helicase